MYRIKSIDILGNVKTCRNNNKIKKYLFYRNALKELEKMNNSRLTENYSFKIVKC